MQSEFVVVYYSRSGNTRELAELIAKRLDCGIEEIIDTKERKGALGMAGAVVRPKGPTTIKTDGLSEPGDRLVIVGTPIWWYSLVPAVTAYFEKFKPKKAAFFFTCGADNKITAFEDMEKQSGVKPVATLRTDSYDMKDYGKCKKVDEFVKKLRAHS